MGTNLTAYEKGDEVALSRAFLQSISDFSYETAQRRGIVTDFEGVFVYVHWRGWHEPVLVNPSNLVRLSRLHLERP